MTFLNPFLLFGLFASAIPILIHLLNKRKLRTIDFSTLAFLKELQKNTMRKITIRQWLLLILRTMLIISLVLAFSRPALKGNFGNIGSHAASTVVIILDNTASMDLHNERGMYLDQAKERAVQIVSMMQNNDDAILIRLSDIPSLTTQIPIHDKKRLLSLINETNVSVKHRTILEALRAASSVVQTSKNANKEIFILTDGQSSTFADANAKGDAEETIFEADVKFFFTRFADSPTDNVGIEKITVPPTLLQVNKPITLNAIVHNYGSNRIENHLVGMSLGSNRVMQKSISLEPGESGAVDFSFTPVRSGFVDGTIALEDDKFEIDNTRSFSLYIPEKISVTLISSAEVYSRYIVTALEAANSLSSSGMVNLRQISPEQISTSALELTDVVIISGVHGVPDVQQNILLKYINGGGNIVFFPGSDTSVTEYPFLRLFNIPVDGIKKAPGQTFFQFAKSDLEFPVFNGMFGTQQLKDHILESPDITTVLSLSAQKNIREIISLSNGSSFFWLRQVQKGKVLGFSVPANTDWSNFPMKGIFVPILYQSLLFLASQEQLESLSKEYIAGERIEFTSTQLRRTKQASNPETRIIDPEKRISPLQSYTKNNDDGVVQTIYTGADLRSTGQYFILSDRDTLGAISVNIYAGESINAMTTHEDVAERLAPLGVKSESIMNLPPESSLQESVQQSRYGVEVWRYFAFFAVLLGLIEISVAREKKET